MCPFITLRHLYSDLSFSEPGRSNTSSEDCFLPLPLGVVAVHGIKGTSREAPGGSVVTTPCSQCRGPRFELKLDKLCGMTKKY